MKNTFSAKKKLSAVLARNVITAGYCFSIPYLVALSQEKLCQVASILPADPRD